VFVFSVVGRILVLLVVALDRHLLGEEAAKTKFNVGVASRRSSKSSENC
jgi:hypothetical protein